MRLHQDLMSCWPQLCHTSASCWISGSSVALASPSSEPAGFPLVLPIPPCPGPCRSWGSPGAQVGLTMGVNHGKSSPAWKIPPLSQTGDLTPTPALFTQTLPPNLRVCSDSLATCLPFFHFPSCLCLATVSRCLPNIPQNSEKSMLRDPKFLLALRVGRGVLGSPSHKARSKSLSKCHGNPPGIEPLISSSSERSLATRLGLLHKAHFSHAGILGRAHSISPSPSKRLFLILFPFPNAKIPKIT